MNDGTDRFVSNVSSEGYCINDERKRAEELLHERLAADRNRTAQQVRVTALDAALRIYSSVGHGDAERVIGDARKIAEFLRGKADGPDRGAV